MSAIPDPPPAIPAPPAYTGPSGYPDYPPPAPRRSGAQTKVTIGFVLAAVGVLFIPIAFNTAALVLGIQAHRQGDPRGRWVIGCAITSFVVGVVISMAVLNANGTFSLAHP